MIQLKQLASKNSPPKIWTDLPSSRLIFLQLEFPMSTLDQHSFRSLVKIVLLGCVFCAWSPRPCSGDLFLTGNLLQNPGAEAGDLRGWTVGGEASPYAASFASIPSYANNGFSARTGDYFMVGGRSGSGFIYQSIDLLIDSGMSADNIDTGSLQVEVGVFHMVFDQRGGPVDAGRLKLEFLDAAGLLIDVVWSPMLINAVPSNASPDQYEQYVALHAIPARTRSLGYELSFILGSGPGSDTDFTVDDLSARVVVPEPSSVLLALLAVITTAFRRIDRSLKLCMACTPQSDSKAELFRISQLGPRPKLHRRRFSKRRPKHLQALRHAFEKLEPRFVCSGPTPIVEDLAYDGSYQPMNGSESYLITGEISGDRTHRYAFYATKETMVRLRLSSMAIGNTGPTYPSVTEVGAREDPNDDSTVDLKDRDGQGENFEFMVEKSGEFDIQVLADDRSFDTVVKYEVLLEGASLPSITIMDAVSQLSGDKFYITNEPLMPELEYRIDGIVLDPLLGDALTWTTTISAESDFSPNQKFDQIETIFGGATMDAIKHRPLFGTQVIGGELSVRIQGSVGTLMVDVSSTANQFKILGTNPEYASLVAYLRSTAVPRLYPVSSGVDYHDLMQAIIRKETGDGPDNSEHNGSQFLDTGPFSGHPKFNTTKDGGVGFSQYTPGNNPAIDYRVEIWDWKKNVDRGLKVFSAKLQEADGWVTGRAYRKSIDVFYRQYGKTNVIVEEVMPIGWTKSTMILAEATTRYNGGNAFKATLADVGIRNGNHVIQVIWNRQPSVYYDQVLGTLERLRERGLLKMLQEIEVEYV
jgi:hypothetical protein